MRMPGFAGGRAGLELALGARRTAGRRPEAEPERCATRMATRVAVGVAQTRDHTLTGVYTPPFNISGISRRMMR